MLAVGDFLYDLAWIHFWAPWYESMADDTLLDDARAFHQANGTPITGFDDRVRCCCVHNGIIHLAYNAFLGDWWTYNDTATRLESFLL